MILLLLIESTTVYEVRATPTLRTRQLCLSLVRLRSRSCCLHESMGTGLITDACPTDLGREYEAGWRSGA